MTPRQTVAPAACAIHVNCGEKVLAKQDWPIRLFTQSDEDAATHLRADKKRTARNHPYLAGASCHRSGKALSRNAVARGHAAIDHRRALGPARIFTSGRRTPIAALTVQVASQIVNSFAGRRGNAFGDCSVINA